ncbi:MAG: BamA/TamA family outer membrane protein [Planctomycetota bacterium]
MRFALLLAHLLAVAVALAASSAAQERPQQQIVAPPLLTERPIVVDIVIEGLVAHDPERVAALLGYRRGQPIPESTTNALHRLYAEYKILVEQGGQAFEEVEGGVIVRLKFIEAPVDLDPRFVGNTKFDVEQLREWALLDDRVEVYVSEAESISERIREAYLRQGYYFVEVEPRLGGEGVRYREIIFEIREGPKVYVKSVDIKGNDSLPNQGILVWRTGIKKYAQVQTKGRGLFAWWGHRFVEEALEGDLVAIAQVYRDRGYLDVVVSYELEFTEDRGGVHVQFEIDEGEQYFVDSVRIKAFDKELVETIPGAPLQVEYREAELSIPEEELMSMLALLPGEPFERARVALDAQTLNDRYGEEGHIDSASFDDPSRTAGWNFLEPQVLQDYERKRVRVTYRVQEGRKFTLRFFEVAGNDNTKDHVVRRRFAQLEGERVDAKKMRDGLRRVRATGFFDDPYAQGTHPPPSLVYRPVEGEPDLVDAVVSVQEGRTINANLSGGIASDQGLVGIISLQINNFDAQRYPSSLWSTFGEVYRKEAFTGDGETFGIDLSPGSEVSYWRVFYSHPDVFRRYFDPIGMLVEVQERDRIFRSHDENRRFARLAVTRAFGQGDVQASFGLRAQEIGTDDLDQGVRLPRTLIDSEGDESFFGLTASISANRLDNRRLPRSGWSARWLNTYYAEVLGSDSNLWKSEVSLDKYVHLSDDLFTAAPGIYLGLGGGVAVPVGDDLGTVNYGERFFFGGARFGRGFRFRGVGPYEGEYPLGGETYLRSTLEYRFPLYTQEVPGTSRRRELFRASLFVDAGVLDPEAYSLDLDEARVSVGIALGLIEPFPVTFSFGFPVVFEDEDERQTFAFTLTLR